MNNLKLLREKLGLTQKELSKELRLSPNTYNGYETGARDPKSDFWVMVAKHYGVSTDFLLGLTDQDVVDASERWPGEIARFAARYQALSPASRGAVSAILNYEESRSADRNESEEERTILYYLVPPAAGYAQPIEGSDYEIIPLPNGAPQNADFCLRVDGDSMEPYIMDGDMVYVKRDAPLSMFDVGIFFFNGSVYIKQYCADVFNNVYLLSANPKREDANVTIMHDDTRTFACFGKVLLPKKLPQPVYR